MTVTNDDELLALAQKVFGDVAVIDGLEVFDRGGRSQGLAMLRAPDRETLAAWLTAMADAAPAPELEPEVVLKWKSGGEPRRIRSDGTEESRMSGTSWAPTGLRDPGLANAISEMRDQWKACHTAVVAIVRRQEEELAMVNRERDEAREQLEGLDT